MFTSVRFTLSCLNKIPEISEGFDMLSSLEIVCITERYKCKYSSCRASTASLAKVVILNFTQLGQRDGFIVVCMLVTLKVHVTKLVKCEVQFKT